MRSSTREVTRGNYRRPTRALQAHRVEAAVDVEDLARGRREEVAQQGADGLRGRGVVGLVPAQRSAVLPRRLEVLEARDRLGGERLERAGGDQVAADALGTEVAGDVPARVLERRLRHAHPVVRR